MIDAIRNVALIVFAFALEAIAGDPGFDVTEEVERILA